MERIFGFTSHHKNGGELLIVESEQGTIEVVLNNWLSDE
jgi:hypothetical protein